MKGIFVYSKNEKKWMEHLHGQPTFSQEWKTPYLTLPLNEVRLEDGLVAEYTQCHTEPYSTNPFVFALEHARRWQDTVILGFGEIFSAHGNVW